MTNIIKKKSILFFISLLLGFATPFGFSPYNFTFINFLTFPLLLYTLEIGKKFRYNNKYFFLIGWFFGFGYFISGLYWIAISLTHDEIFKTLIPISVILLPSFLAIFYGIATLTINKFICKKISFILIFSLAFSIIEFIRGNILTGFPWNLIAYTWSWSLETIQSLSLVGTYSFNLFSFTVFSLPFIFFDKLYFKRKFLFTFLVISIFFINYGYGFINLYKNNQNLKKSDFILKIVSPSIELDKFINVKNTDKIIKKLVDLSNPQFDQKTIFIWPEGMFPFIYLNELKKFKKIFSESFSDSHLIIFGITESEYKNNKENIFNSLVVVDNKLNLIAKYDKNKLVPFGEFLPLENLFSKFGLKKITYGYQSFSKGETRNILNIKNQFHNLKILPLICYEIIYSGQINKTKQDVDLIVNISEDGWFGDSIGPHQHFYKAVYRAVEEGNYIARSANNGISAFISPNGKILDRVRFDEANTIITSLPKNINKERTFFSQYGNKIFIVIIFLYIFLIFYFKKVEKNEKNKLSFY